VQAIPAQTLCGGLREMAKGDPVRELHRFAGELLTRYRPPTDQYVGFVLGELGPARYAFQRSMLEIKPALRWDT
jgi:hypothetical protein